MTTLNGLLIPWDSFIEGICAIRKLISFSQLQEQCTQEEARIITREEKMGATKDQALTTHTRKSYKNKDNHHHKKKKDNKKNKFIKDPSNIRCYTCDEKGHFARDCPNKKKIHHTHTVEDDEPTNKIFRGEMDDLDEEYVLISALMSTISHESNDWLVDSGESKHMTGYKHHSSICLNMSHLTR